ncbi:MAG: hypothetical protein PVI59_05060 [Anaerolineae bacterium]|jgi:capsular polysaccharide biosynthesis protein
MEVRQLIKTLIRRWWLVIAPAVVVLAATALTYQTPPTVYQVVMRYAAGTEPAGLSVDYDRYYPWLTSEYIANGLADVAETSVFAEAVAARLTERGLAVEPAAIQSAIVTDNAQSILVIYLTWPTADQAPVVAEAVTEELTENSSAYFPQLKNLEPALHLLDDPSVVPLPPGLRTQILGPAVRVGLALAVGIALSLVWHYLDPTVREAEELEAMGLPVLGRIP